MNQASSRSHAIFTITVECSEKVVIMILSDGNEYNGPSDDDDDDDDPW